jgi:D-3-phosphoglycerate dehydrogenase
MRVIAFDPFLSPERAVEIGVEKVELEEIFHRSDFISLHTPLTERTRNIIDAAALAKCRKGVRIINCARGGLVVEDALYDGLMAGHVGGAALDVFDVEPAMTHKLFDLENVVATPHLGASTGEAQENVALQVAEQMSDYLLHGAVSNALNMPSISADEAPRLKPFIAVAEKLGSFAGQLTDQPITGIVIEYAGEVGEMNTRALTSAALAGVLQPMLGTVNMVSAPVVAKERGIKVDEVRQSQRGAYETYIRFTVRTEGLERSVAGTVFSDGKPRIIQIKGIDLEAEFGAHMLYLTNMDKPGFIGAIGTLLGNAGVNIATFNLGRTARGADAICLIQVDEPISEDVLDAVRTLPHVRQAKPLAF